MVGWECVPIICFEGEKPYITVRLKSLSGELLELNLRVDTGFDGSILLDNSTYSKFIKGELPESLWFRFRTLNGYLIMRTAKAILDFADKEIETYVLTPKDFDGKNLIGLELIRELRVLLDKGRTCMIK
jgi:predicted aspartyl protease